MNVANPMSENLIEIPDFSPLISNTEYEDLYDHKKITMAMQLDL